MVTIEFEENSPVEGGMTLSGAQEGLVKDVALKLIQSFSNLSAGDSGIDMHGVIPID